MAQHGVDGFPVLEPKLQIAFYYMLKAVRETYLGEALSATVKKLETKSIDDDLNRYVRLARLTGFGLRGERVFPVPCVMTANPSLLGYYRLLYGLSQKEFYNKGPFGRFRVLEDKGGDVPHRLLLMVEPLCRSLISTGQQLVEEIDCVSLDVVHELQLLTLGPQLRGSRNTKIGQDASKEVFELIRSIVAPYVRKSDDRMIRLENDSGRIVRIEFASDPDICITEQLDSGDRASVAIEIKGGTDPSNIHNRLGEAEKSHQKAKGKGFFEFWTIVRVDVDDVLAKRESPTTSHLFHLNRIKLGPTEEHKVFRDMLGSLLGIRTRE